MIIHLAASRQSAVRSISLLREIISVIYRSGHILARDWVEPLYSTAKSGLKDLSPQEIYKFNMEAIERADIVIVEGSAKSFSTGFQIAAALQKKKPTLLLISRDKIDEESGMSKGISDALLTRREYADNLDLVVKGFIEENTVNNKDLRFNFVLDRSIYNYLRLKAYKTKSTKAEVVRELLQREMERDS